MKWLKSTTDKAYTAQGHTIPASTSAPVGLNESVYESITNMPVIKSLIATGGIIVLDRFTGTPPKDAAAQKLQTLASENARLADRVRELEKAGATDPKALSKAEKAKAVAEKAKEDTEKKLAELQAKYEALEAEANAKIAELSK